MEVGRRRTPPCLVDAEDNGFNVAGTLPGAAAHLKTPRRRRVKIALAPDFC